jgi:alpha-mannosidase
LPDEFLVSGEAIVRNLLLGERIARSYGRKMEVGYIPDPFGHISQMPQILRGLGMDCAAVCRGLDDQQTEGIWEAPDGSRVWLFYLRDSYDNAMHLPVQDDALFVKEIVRLRESLEPYLTTPYALLMHGTDHMEPAPRLPVALKSARRQLPDYELVHGTLPMYIDAVKHSLGLDPDAPPKAAGSASLACVQGELRSSKRHHLLPGVLSARMWIKQRNHFVQNLLERWAEPFCALAAIGHAGTQALAQPDSPQALIRQAWKYLLHNQAHDSICGCSIDATHHDMVTRFDWAEQIGEEVVRQSLASLASQVRTRFPQASALPVVVFNPLLNARSDLVDAQVQVPGSLEEFQVVDESGQPVPHQVVSRKGAEFASMELGRDEVLGLTGMVDSVSQLGLAVQEIRVTHSGDSARIDVTLLARGRTESGLVAGAQQQVQEMLADPAVRTFAVRAHMATTVTFRFVAADVPGCGYKAYFLTENVSAAKSVDTATSEDYNMENEFLSVAVAPQDGTLSVTDKATGAVFSGLQRFVDGGDRGDEYNYCPPESDAIVSAPVAPPEITWLERGPARWTVQVKQTYRLPAALSEDRSARSENMVDLPITSQIHLVRGVPRVDVRTELDNRAGDHRLRVLFPTRLHADCSEAESSFDVVRRPLGVPANTRGWKEQPVPTHPQQAFVAVNAGTLGLMIANRGLPEFEVLQEKDGSATIALTLLRSVGWLSRDDFPCRRGHAGPALETPEAQCLGPATFEYSIVPHSGTWQKAYMHAHAFDTPLRAVSTDQHDGALPPTASWVQIEGAGLVLSAVKAAESADGLIVRVYNASEQPVAARLRTYMPILAAQRVNLAEQELYALDVDRGVSTEVKGKQIASFKLTF